MNLTKKIALLIVVILLPLSMFAAKKNDKAGQSTIWDLSSKKGYNTENVMQACKLIDTNTNMEVASALLRNEIQNEPKNYVAWFLLGTAQTVLRDSEQAVSALKEALALTPKEDRLVRSKIYQFLGMNEADRGNNDLAENYFTQAQKEFENNADLYRVMTKAYLQSSKFTQSKESGDKYMSFVKRPDEMFLTTYCASLIMTKELKKARTICDSMISIKPEVYNIAAFYRMRSNINEMEGKPKEMLSDIITACKWSDLSFMVSVISSLVNFDVNSKKVAFDILRDKVATDPDTDVWKLMLGYLYNSTGDSESAMSYFQTLFDKGAYINFIAADLFNSQMNMGNINCAQQTFKKAKESIKDQKLIVRMQNKLYMRKGEFDKASKLIEQSHDSIKFNGHIANNYINSLLAEKRYDDAIKHIDTLSVIYPKLMDDWTFLCPVYLLGGLYKRIGDKNKADFYNNWVLQSENALPQYKIVALARLGKTEEACKKADTLCYESPAIHEFFCTMITYSYAGKYDEATKYARLVLDRGYTDLWDMTSDVDIIPELQNYKAYKELIEEYKNKIETKRKLRDCKEE